MDGREQAADRQVRPHLVGGILLLNFMLQYGLRELEYKLENIIN
jgi:hypothetical protein